MALLAKQDPHAQLALKLKLEATFRRDLRLVFNRIIREYQTMIAAGYAPTGRNADKYRGHIGAIISLHYERVQKAFSGLVVAPKKQDDENRDELFLLLLNWRDSNSDTSAGQITSTTSENMVDAYSRAMDQLMGERPDGVSQIDTGALSVLAALGLRRKLYGREETIATFETQKAAESTKLIEGLLKGQGLSVEEVNASMSRGTRQSPKPLVFKTWVSLRDNRVRQGHRVAEGQTVPAEEPFIVSNQRLMFPGDTTLGASVENTINCRCTAIYSTK